MGHEDWDLSAIVRSCKAPNTNNNNNSEEAPTNSNTGLLLPQDTSSANNAPFSSFPNLMQSRTNAFQELHQLLETFNPTTTATTSTSAPGGINIIPNSPPFPDFTPGSIAQHHHHSPSVLVPTTNYTSIGASTSASFDRFHHHHQQHHQQHQQQQPQPQEQKQHNQPQVQVAQTSSVALLQNTQSSQTPRSRKRKSLQKKMVCHVTADNLSADLWAWRKYGQKPIKGSPYPRNYYRCSSCKGCVARKQVERSLTDPGMFVVTYTGEHRHAKPVHRNSLAGSTRNKTTRSAATTTQPDPHSKTESSMNSSNFSQVSTQTTTSHQEDVVSGPAEDSWREGDRVTEQELDSLEEEDDEDDVLIPNDTAALSDTVFLDPITFTAEAGDGKTSPGFKNRSDPSTKPD